MQSSRLPNEDGGERTAFDAAVSDEVMLQTAQELVSALSCLPVAAPWVTAARAADWLSSHSSLSGVSTALVSTHVQYDSTLLRRRSTASTTLPMARWTTKRWLLHCLYGCLHGCLHGCLYGCLL